MVSNVEIIEDNNNSGNIYILVFSSTITRITWDI